jgi:hypothetical protein
MILLTTALLALLLSGTCLLRSGNGGSVGIGTGTVVVVPVGRWNGNWRSRDAEVTQSDSGGGTVYFHVVYDPEWEFTAARDDVLFPESLGFTEGSAIAVLWFKLGAGTKADKVVNTFVSEVNTVCDNAGDVVRVTVRGKGGVRSASQTIA